MMRRIRVLIVDDSALVRQMLEAGLQRDTGLEVVGTAADPFIARDKIIELRPDVLTLDVEMPRMDGVEFLRKLMPQYPIPVVMVSSLTEKGKSITLEALEAGAVDYVFKPAADRARKLSEIMLELATKIKIAANANLSHWKNDRKSFPATVKSSASLSESTDKVIAIGASTGGTEALKVLLSALPVTTPGIVVVQHMPGGFTKMFADRLDQICAMQVVEAKDGDRILNGKILIAPGGYQCRVKRSGGQYTVQCTLEDKFSGHCPSVDILFQSVSQQVGRNAVGVILTGMGSDGAQGLKAMRAAGSHTLGQDEASCVVFGMPKAAQEFGGVEMVLPLDKIAPRLQQLCL
jgi:two-component system, chemotaxis family, protein-glutamate methylesterase/glutaminase